ncbi:MAG: response regulator [Abitibacteriaceae bacterium]|nr:response regulator [Abditibacteriaceae bacterium]
MAPGTQNGESGPYRILLVEEDKDSAQAILQNLSRAKLDCRYATDANTGWQAFEQTQPHLVLLNLGLPDLGGFVLCPKIREQSTVPIIIVSLRKRKEDQLHALKIGADDFLIRPIDDDLLLARCLTLLRRAYRYDARAEQDTLQAALQQNPSQSIQSTLPSDWVTCDSCSYMGPGHRFDRLNAAGERVMMCPHCNHTQMLTYTLR